MVSQDKDIEFSIVSGSNEEMLFGCVDSLRSTMQGSRYAWSLTITCNATGKGLAARLRAAYPDAFIIDNAAPRGFAANHNRVLQSSHARYVWLLNDDLLILPDAIRMVTEFMDRPENSRVAAVSPRLLNPDGSLQPSTYGFPSMPQILLAHSGLRGLRVTEAVMRRVAPILRSRAGSSRHWAHDRTIEVDTLRGACVAMRMKAVDQVGLMTEVAIVGGEETEWHRRFHERGWKVIYFADASVIHYGSQTVRDGSKSLYPEYLKGALYYFKTGKSKASYPLFCASLLTMFGVRAAFAWVMRNKNEVSVSKRYASVAWNGLRGRIT
ncbi:MAG TPA: glycosyltransferase [Gemmatimonadaceae bacterium]|nr:glycosyltransferase [Gemmatimonadaceae bacterium]